VTVVTLSHFNLLFLYVLHDEEFNNLYTLLRIIRMINSRRMSWIEQVSRMREQRNVCRDMVGKPEGKRPLARPGRKWEDNIKLVLMEKEWGGMDWIRLAQDRDQWQDLVNTVMNFRAL
jgi:hypothetical protein